MHPSTVAIIILLIASQNDAFSKNNLESIIILRYPI
jgi:hypothetical protein